MRRRSCSAFESVKGEGGRRRQAFGLPYLLKARSRKKREGREECFSGSRQKRKEGMGGYAFIG